MRVTSGTAKGRVLKTPPRTAPIRPVEDRVKQAIFNILFDVTDARVLDCFAGTGALGIEALSRGAAHATFIDAGKIALGLIAANLHLCQLDDRATIFPMTAERALAKLAHSKRQFDLLFVDPPYQQNFVNPSLQLIATGSLIAPGGQLLIERHPKEALILPEGLSLADERTYGQTVVSFVKASHA